jgi:hypothetical protein
VAVRRQGAFGVAWTEGSSFDRARFARVSITGIESDVAPILESAEPHELLKLVATSQGYVLVLVTGTGENEFQYFLSLDQDGQPSASAKRLEGQYLGWDLAANGDNLGFVATRALTYQSSFRPLDQDLNAIGPWVCLDGPASTFDAMAVDADPSGFAVLYRAAPPIDDPTAPDRAVMFVRFDTTGTGDP